ncbi:tripartite tricarboxylate transporter substrate binding protein (plasmid) [Cupriavidus pinatubonensis]|uniref:Bug family tripartite tricarboxylate transporter substrate binding protein n=1 Tax=Cupriavidus pinatubonensis TaxID=248026 RepID=UPI001C7370E6|nr:tripartite tricarboxylate transporter substrate binding protein [Cupriavidus pinatubonensis]QYY33662.1 tripartite tricarboxylate transporter substrate binding protein [Cupriavidus pinatubonensis]
MSSVSRSAANWTATLLAGLSCLVSPGLHAQEFPSRRIILVVPYPPANAADYVARLIQPRLAAALNQTVVVENRPGASTNIGTAYVAHAVPDGHTLLFQVPNIATNEFMFKRTGWKRDDFVPVGALVRWSNVLVAGPSAPHTDFKQLLNAKNTSSLNYGSPGVGSLSNLAVEMLKGKSGLQIQHVIYSGTAPMMNDLLGGNIQYGATNPANFMSYVGDSKRKIKPLVVLGAERDTTIPNVPALSEFGISGIESSGWLGVLAPAKTPPATVARLNAEFKKILQSPDVIKQLKDNYLQPFPSTPEEFASLIAAENKKWGAAIKAANIEAQ